MFWDVKRKPHDGSRTGHGHVPYWVKMSCFHCLLSIDEVCLSVCLSVCLLWIDKVRDTD